MLSTEMNWEVVQDFLNVSGIKGVALIDGQSRPYFKGIEKVLNSQQRDALAQGVWQVLETIPENFDSFEFQFAGTQVYIHKMTQGLILLVLTHDSLLYPDYCEAFTKLKGAFEADGEATLESFRRLLGARNTTVVSPSELAGESAPVAAPPVDELPVPAEQAARETAIAQEIAQDLAAQNGQGGAAFTTATTISDPLQSAEAPPPSGAQSRPDLEDTLRDVFAEDKVALEKASLKQAAEEQAAQQRAAQARAEQERAAQEKVAQEKAAQEKAAQEKVLREQAAQKKAAQEKAAQEKAAQARVAQARAAQQQAAALKRQETETIQPAAAKGQSLTSPPPLESAQLADTFVEMAADDADMADNPFAPAMAAPPDALTETFAQLPEDAPAAELPEIGLPNVDMPDQGLPDVGLSDVELPQVELPDVVDSLDALELAPPDLPSNFAAVSLSEHQTTTEGFSPALETPDLETPDLETPGIDTEASAQGLPLEDWLAALNCLGQCAVHYLGRAVVVNYWRTSRPESDWLAKFEVERSSHILADGDLPLAHGTTVEQQLELQDWADQFAQRCGRVIRDFPQLAETQGLQPEQRDLLGL